MNTTQPVEDICKAHLAGYQRGLAIGPGLPAGTVEEMVKAYVNEELAAAWRIGFDAGRGDHLPEAVRAVHIMLDEDCVPVPTNPAHTPAGDPSGLAWRVHNLLGNLERAKFLLAAMATGDETTVVQALDDIDAGTDDSDTGAHPVTGGQARPTTQRIQAFLDACYGEEIRPEDQGGALDHDNQFVWADSGGLESIDRNDPLGELRRARQALKDTGAEHFYSDTAELSVKRATISETIWILAKKINPRLKGRLDDPTAHLETPSAG